MSIGLFDCWINVFAGSGLQCYSCGHDEEMCSVSSTGPTVYCQTDNPENRNYGDSCYVGHSGDSISWFSYIYK